MDLLEARTTVYTAQSRQLFYARMLICKYVLEQGAVPLNPFNLWGYFLYELVERDLVRRGNNNLLRLVDEVWVFGPIADGVLAEINYAMALQKPVRFFTAGSKLSAIAPIAPTEIAFESGAIRAEQEEQTRVKIENYVRRM